MSRRVIPIDELFADPLELVTDRERRLAEVKCDPPPTGQGGRRDEGEPDLEDPRPRSKRRKR